MSDERGSGHGGFLARWSQRKRAVAAEPPVVEIPATEAVVEAAPAEDVPAEEAFDLASLPSLDEITGESDVAAFLQKGVPEALKNAALRKVWTLDPILKDYIGPVDYGWDYNDPAGVPGFGPLSADLNISQMSRQIFGEKAPEDSVVESAAPPAEERPVVQPEAVAAEEAGMVAEAEFSPEAIEMDAPEPVFPRRKRHGGAVPG